MNCKTCGNPLSETEKFCVVCGTPVENPSVPMGQPMGVVPMVPPPVPMQQPAPMPGPMPVPAPIQQPAPMPGPMPVPAPMQQPAPMPGPMPAPVPMQQPAPMPGPMQSPMGGAPAPMPPNFQPMPTQMPIQGKNNLPMIIGAILVVTVVIVIALVFILGGDKKSNDNKNTNSNSNGGSTEVAKTYDLTDGKFTYKIPTDLLSTTQSNGVMVYDVTETWYAWVGSVQTNTANMTASSVKMSLQNNGCTVEKSETKKIAGKEYIVANLEYQGEKMILVYYKFNSTNALAAEIYSTNPSAYANEKLEVVAPVLGNAVQGNSSLGANKNIDLSKGI